MRREEDLARLLAQVRDEDAAVADLRSSLRRLEQAHTAKVQLATLPAEELRQVLQVSRRQTPWERS